MKDNDNYIAYEQKHDKMGNKVRAIIYTNIFALTSIIYQALVKIITN